MPSRRDSMSIYHAPQEDMTSEDTARAARLFLRLTGARYDLARAVLYGSRARRDGDVGSDLDIAVVLRGAPSSRADAAIDMAGIAFDVMLETGVLVDPLPLWEDEWQHPEHFSNPSLIENIRRDGVAL